MAGISRWRREGDENDDEGHSGDDARGPVNRGKDARSDSEWLGRVAEVGVSMANGEVGARGGGGA